MKRCRCRQSRRSEVCQTEKEEGRYPLAQTGCRPPKYNMKRVHILLAVTSAHMMVKGRLFLNRPVNFPVNISLSVVETFEYLV